MPQGRPDASEFGSVPNPGVSIPLAVGPNSHWLPPPIRQAAPQPFGRAETEVPEPDWADEQLEGTNHEHNDPKAKPVHSAEQAKSMGFDVSWMKMVLSHIETETQMVDDNVAEVRINCNRRRAVNPVFALVAKLFSLGETYNVEETLTLVKEDGLWKVCGEPFALVGG